jgi:NAD(P)-dependent dehydrogenase (short-subunit alcohol dehydrogenase family)
MLLAEQVVIVSGVGPGLGRALARRVAGHGAKVVLVARSADRLDAVADEIRVAGGSAMPVAADASSPDDAARVVDVARREFGRIDGLVNNAAVVPPLAPASEVGDEVLQSTLDGNFGAAYHLTRAVLPLMRERGRGSVVMIASAVFRHPKPGFGAYNVAKHALIGFARSLALELGPEGIRVNTLAPGKIAGERLEAYFAERAPALGVDVGTLRSRYVENIALRRLPEPDEYADAAVFLLSDLSRAITGHILDANGGEYFD